jgi:hypothetical protein
LEQLQSFSGIAYDSIDEIHGLLVVKQSIAEKRRRRICVHIAGKEQIQSRGRWIGRRWQHCIRLTPPCTAKRRRQMRDLGFVLGLK